MSLLSPVGYRRGFFGACDSVVKLFSVPAEKFQVTTVKHTVCGRLTRLLHHETVYQQIK